METTISFEGTYKGAPAKMYVTFVGIPTSPGVIHGEGQGVVIAGESDEHLQGELERSPLPE